MVTPDNMNIVQDAELSKYTSLGIGGTADYLVRVKSKPELYTVLEWAEYNGLKVTVIGRGTKLLVSDKGVRGVVLQMLGMDAIVPVGNTITAEVGASLVRVANLAVASGLKGLEWAVGIPASVGGAVTMNAGAFGGSMSDVVGSVEYYNGRSFVTASLEECGFGYRKSVFADNPDYIITQAVMEFKPSDAAELAREMERCKQRRGATQPIGLRSAGSTFKRPSESVSAGELIERAGLKGYTVGGAEVSVLHANFIVNRGGARCADVLELMKVIQDTVKTKFGVALEPEIKTIGEF